MVGVIDPTSTNLGVTNMVIPTVNFLSYNSTGMNIVKSNWMRNLCKIAKCDFISIQEHFKKNKSIDKVFKDQFPKHRSYRVFGNERYRSVCLLHS